MVKKKLIPILFFIIILNSNYSYSQNFLSWKYTDRYFSIQVGTGNVNYFGELNNEFYFYNDPSIATIALEARLLSKISARIEANYYYLEATDAIAPDSSKNKQRNLNFFSHNFDFALQGVYYFRKYSGNYHSRWNIDPYVTLGVGFTTLNPKTILNGETYTLRDYKTENVSYSKIALMIPASIGIKFKVNEFLNFNLETSFRYTFSDYIDDVSTTYPKFNEDNISSALSNRKDEIPVINKVAYAELVSGKARGNSNDNDTYLLIQLKFELYLSRGNSSNFKKTK